MKTELLNQHPLLVAIAGSNVAGKTTFYNTFLRDAGLPFINADILALQFGLDAYTAAECARIFRETYVKQRRSFVFETVFSDEQNEKLSFMKKAAELGYTVILLFIGVESPEVSISRVAMRVTKGGHDIPNEKLYARFPRTLANLKRAVQEVPCVFIYDNSDLSKPYQRVAEFESGRAGWVADSIPMWLNDVIKR